MATQSFTLRLPTTAHKTVWIGYTGGHYDIVYIALEWPRNRKVEDRLKNVEGQLVIPKGTLTISIGDFCAWYGEEAFVLLQELGLTDPENAHRPLSTEVIKWVKATIELPLEHHEGISIVNKQPYNYDEVWGLNFYSDGEYSEDM